MITRMIASLKKATSLQKARQDIEAPTGLPTSLQDSYIPRGADGIQLSVLKCEWR